LIRILLSSKPPYLDALRDHDEILVGVKTSFFTMVFQAPAKDDSFNPNPSEDLLMAARPLHSGAFIN
jgi:hypothetical protein